MLRRFDAIGFDLDGTLWDSTSVSCVGWRRTVAALALDAPDVTDERIRDAIGLPQERFVEFLYPGVPADRLAAIAEELSRQEDRAAFESHPVLYPGVADGLARLAAVFPLFLVSNCPTGYLDIFLGFPEIRGLFRTAVCAEGTGKPKAANIRDAAAANAWRTVAYVGDTAGDERASRESDAVFFHMGYRSRLPESVAPSFARFEDLVARLLDGDGSVPTTGN